MTGTGVTLCYLTAHPTQTSLEELLISPIPFARWRYLTRINARMEDRPGTIERLVNAIENMSLEILYEASGSIENNVEQKKVIRIEFMVDAQKYYSNYGDESGDDHVVLGKLERYLKAVCFDDLLLDGKRLRLKVRPMEGLRSAHALKSEAVHSTVQNGSIQLPDQLKSIFNRRYYLVSDTKDHVLRAYFLRPDEDCICIRVSHNDNQKALSRISSKLTNDFIILTSLSRIKAREKEEVEFMLYSRQFPLRQQADQRIKRLQQLFAGTSLDALQLSMDYWEPDQKSWQNIPLAGSGEHQAPPSNGGHGSKTTCQLLDERFKSSQELAHQETDHATSRWHQRKCEAAYDLLLSEQSERVPSRIFISYQFNQPEMFQAIKDQFKDSESGCSIIDGSNPYDKDEDSNAFREVIIAFKEVIIKRIYSSSGFIGIWKSEDKQPNWLLWELSIANAFGLPYLLFVHKDFRNSFHTTIFSEQHHIPFVDLDQTILTKPLKLFRKQVRNYEQQMHEKNGRNFNRFSRYN